MKLFKVAVSILLTLLLGACSPKIDYDAISPDIDLSPNHTIWGWGYVDQKEHKVIASQFQEARPFKEERAAVKKDGKWGFIDKTGNVIVELKYTEVRDFLNDRAVVMVDKGSIWMHQYRYGIIDNQGNEITPCKFGRLGNFSEGLAAVSSENGDTGAGEGYIDENGIIVIPGGYLQAEEFHNGVARVETINGLWITIDKTGNEVK